MLFTYRYTLTVWEKNASADKKWNQLFQVRTGVEFEEAILHLWESLLFFMKNPKPNSMWEKHQVDKVWEYQFQEKIWVYSDKYIIVKKVREEKDAYDEEYLLVIDDPVSSYDFENRIGILSFLKYKLSMFLEMESGKYKSCEYGVDVDAYDGEAIMSKHLYRGLEYKHGDYPLYDKEEVVGVFGLRNMEELMKITDDFGMIRA